MAEYTQLYINNDMSKLNTILQTLVTNGIVGAVDYDSSGTYPVFKLYADAEKTTEVFRITQAQGYSAGYVKYTFTATASDGTLLSSTGAVDSGYKGAGFAFMYGYSCPNGVMIGLNVVTISGSNSFPNSWLIITKNQNDVPVFIWTNNPSASGSTTEATKNNILSNMNTEYIVAASDVAPLSTFPRLAPAVRNQIQIAPFVTSCGSSETSYTPNAGRILGGNMNQFIYDATAHEISFDGAAWLTNGYWTLKVGAAA